MSLRCKLAGHRYAIRYDGPRRVAKCLRCARVVVS